MKDVNDTVWKKNITISTLFYGKAKYQDYVSVERKLIVNHLYNFLSTSRSRGKQLIYEFREFREFCSTHAREKN